MIDPEYVLGQRFVRSLPKRDPLRVAAQKFHSEHLASFVVDALKTDDKTILIGQIWVAIREGSQLTLAEFCEIAEINPVHQSAEALSFLLGIIGGAA